jgi:iron complex transport system ATP-binding protein
MAKMEMQNVTLTYGQRSVVRELSLHIYPGELLGLVGPNGCGKTSIIKALSHVLIPDAGRILLDGQELGAISRTELARLIGVVPQNPSLPDTFTVFEVAILGRNPHLGLLSGETARDMAVVWQAMEKIGITHLAKRRIGELSGGEKQRVTIARVLAQEPQVILMDEPTANLDIFQQMDILDLITGMCREKNTAGLIAIHDLNIAAQYCTRIIMLKNGQIRAEGMPKEVVTAENVREVFGADTTVYPHPENNLPMVLPNTGCRHSGNGNKEKQANKVH